MYLPFAQSPSGERFVFNLVWVDRPGRTAMGLKDFGAKQRCEPLDPRSRADCFRRQFDVQCSQTKCKDVRCLGSSLDGPSMGGRKRSADIRGALQHSGPMGCDPCRRDGACLCAVSISRYPANPKEQTVRLATSLSGPRRSYLWSLAEAWKTTVRGSIRSGWA